MIKRQILALVIGTASVLAQYPQPGPMSEPDHWQTILWLRSLTIDQINSYRAENGLSILHRNAELETKAQAIVMGNATAEHTPPTSYNTNTTILPSIGFTTGQSPFPVPPEFDADLAFRSAAYSANGLLSISAYDIGNPPPETSPNWHSIGIGTGLYSSALDGNELIYSAVTHFSETPGSRTKISEILPGAMPLGGDWHYSAWLGSLYVDALPVVLLWGVGYAYFDVTASDGYHIRYWDPGLGWLRTTTRLAYQGFYWSETESNWLYRSLSSTWPRLVYSYSRSVWDFVY